MGIGIEAQASSVTNPRFRKLFENGSYRLLTALLILANL